MQVVQGTGSFLYASRLCHLQIYLSPLEITLEHIQDTQVAVGTRISLPWLEILGGELQVATKQCYTCRIKYFVTLERHAGEDTGTVNNDAHTVSLNNMFATAKSFKVGSREYNDLVDLMARLFPDNAEANIDAAGVALLRGDLKQIGRAHV